MEKHTHIYDDEGNQLCCTLEDKINKEADRSSLQQPVDDDCCNHHAGPKQAHLHKDSHEHDHVHEEGIWSIFRTSGISLVLLCLGLGLDHFVQPVWFKDYVRILFYLIAYLPVGWPVLRDAWISISKGQFFSEFFLMGIATIGAFAIGEYPESVAVMLFYTIGEGFQVLAVKRAKFNIQTLLDQRPDEVTILSGGKTSVIKAVDAVIGDVIQLKPGEKSGLDGTLLSETAWFNTSALTGESVPVAKKQGEAVLAGMINLNTVSMVEVTTAYENSKLARILTMVREASGRKAPTELFIRKFAKIYTPIVVGLATAICFLPFLILEDYDFRTWLYRALVFLVISCPCALVISIPLGYFGGIGAASRNGILVKGGNFLDILAGVKHVVMDKTGTLTEGVFEVRNVKILPEFDEKETLHLVNALQAKSSHPVASAIRNYVVDENSGVAVIEVEEIGGLGLKGIINGKNVLTGNAKLLDKYGVTYPSELSKITETVIAIALDGVYAGHLTISDKIKGDSKKAIEQLHDMGIRTTMLSGDKAAVVESVSSSLGIDQAHGDLLPEDKVNKVKELKLQKAIVAFVGDGVNDAPVMALSDVGIAMGGLGSDMTIETADVVIQDDNPGKIAMAVRIGKQTKRIVWQNISMAFVVKAVVLIIGAGGLATMWEAVFADVGVALLAIFNAVRIQNMKF